MKDLLLLLFVCAACTSAGAGTLRGRVAETGTGEELPGVNVVLVGTLMGTVTGAGGEFVLTGIPSGKYEAAFSLVGYARTIRSVEILQSDTTDVAVSLPAVALQTDPVVVTAARREQSILESPVSISVLDASAVSRRNAIVIDDALRYIPGVNMTEFQVNIRGSSGYSRGAGSRVLMLVDGIPLLTGDSGEINYETVPVGQIDRIEVLKGASSALYGSSALGGVINVITRPIGENPETRLRLYGGFYGTPSFERWDWGGGTRFLDGQSFSHSGKSGGTGYRFLLSRQADDGYRQNDHRRRYNGSVKTTFDLSRSDALTLNASFLHQARASFLYWRDLAHALTPPDDQRGHRIESTRWYLSGVYHHVFSPALMLTGRALWFRNRFWDNIGVGGDRSLSHVGRGETQVTWNPGAAHILTAGLEGSFDRVDASIFGERKGETFAFYAQDEITIGAFSLTVGARYDFSDVDSLDAVSQFNPKAALTYTPFDGTVVRASWGRGFRSPSVAEAFTSTTAAGLRIVPNPHLRPERSTSYEIGLQQVVGEVAVLDAALFVNDFDDLIESGLVSGAQLVAQFNNVTRARISGGEAAVKTALFGRSIFVDVGYTYVNPRDRSLNTELKYRPRHLVYVSAVAHVGPLTVSGDYRHISRVEQIDEELVRAGVIRDGDRRVPVNVVDLRVGSDLGFLGFPLTAQVNVNNVFQYNYVELIGNLAPPRSIVLTLDADL
jgi:iron complex outermembrane receptor protein